MENDNSVLQILTFRKEELAKQFFKSHEDILSADGLQGFRIINKKEIKKLCDLVQKFSKDENAYVKIYEEYTDADSTNIEEAEYENGELLNAQSFSTSSSMIDNYESLNDENELVDISPITREESLNDSKRKLVHLVTTHSCEDTSYALFENSKIAYLYASYFEEMDDDEFGQEIIDLIKEEKIPSPSHPFKYCEDDEFESEEERTVVEVINLLDQGDEPYCSFKSFGSEVALYKFLEKNNLEIGDDYECYR